MPTGLLHEWPSGSPVTLHSLAGWMIARSDNTATDHLIRLLGREPIERVLPVMGHASPMRNQPFLSTMEMFKLKWGPDRQAAATFPGMTIAQKRRYLDETVARIARDQVRFTGTQPLAISTVEWFASSADLCRAMAWLHQHSLKQAGQAARGILAINPGLAFTPQSWRYVAYKGGSEPGVLNMTFLMESAHGERYAMSGSWNHAGAPLDEGRFMGLMQHAIHLLETPER